MTILYALWMLITFVVSIHQSTTMDNTELNNDLVPYSPEYKASKIMLLVWAMYIVQMVILVIYDWLGR